jgi:acyl carrier protein
MNFNDEIREFVRQNFLFGDGGTLLNDDSFLEKGIVDSTGILEIIAFIEKKYGINVDDSELLPENLDSINNIAAFLERKNAGKQ